MLPLLRCFFAHLLTLQYPDHHQNLISSCLYYSGPVHKMSSQSVHNFLSNVVHRQTDRQKTDKLTNATKNIASFAKEVIRAENSVYEQLLCVLMCKNVINAFNVHSTVQLAFFVDKSLTCKKQVSPLIRFLKVQVLDY